MDVVVGLDGEAEQIVERVLAKLGGEDKTIVRHDTNFSFLTRESYQVDMNFCPKENFQFLLAFKSNNDFGGLVGHLLSSLAMKLSDKGLILKVKVFNVPEIGTVKKEVVLTKEPGKVCDFLGLPRFCLDGHTRMSSKQIFQVITESQIFERELYDSQAFVVRHKVQRRPLSREFCRLLQNFSGENHKEENIFKKFRKNSILLTEYYNNICLNFNQVDKLQIIHENCAKQKQTVDLYKCKFSFEVLLETYPDMEKEQGGNILRKLKRESNKREKGGFSKWVHQTDLKEIFREVERVRQEK